MEPTLEGSVRFQKLSRKQEGGYPGGIRITGQPRSILKLRSNADHALSPWTKEVRGGQGGLPHPDHFRITQTTGKHLPNIPILFVERLPKNNTKLHNA